MNKLVSLSPAQYSATFEPVTPFGSVDFALLNRDKVGDVLFLAMFDESDRPRLGIILGRRDSKLFCPFSAPYGEISSANQPSQADYDTFFELIREKFGADNVEITLSPSFYAPESVALASHSLNTFGRTLYDDINYHFILSDIEDYNQVMHRNARKNLNHGIGAGLQFRRASLAEAYDVIRINRALRNHPLRMTLNQLEAASRIIDIDSFVVEHGSLAVAAAIAYRLNSEVVRVVYWGHIPNASSLRPVNFLSFKLFEYYHSLGFRYADIGISSVHGVADPGLCSFKESIGCRPSPQSVYRL